MRSKMGGVENDIKNYLNSFENEEVLTEVKDVTLVLNNANKGEGTVLLTNVKILWVGDSPSNLFQFSYKTLMFHAVSRDPNLFKRPCIFIQFNLGHDEEQNEVVLLSPIDSAKVDSLFSQISKFSTLNDENNTQEDSGCEVYEDEEDDD